jgi:hypothetical protein
VAFEDIDALAQDVAELFADAKLNYEATQFITGSGSAPHGIVADVGAVTASRVSPATGGTFAAADMFTVHRALPPRFRNSPAVNRAWMASVQTIDKMRTFATSNVYYAFLSNATAGMPAQLLGDNLYEASAMSSSYTTGQDVLLLADWTRYYVVDRLDLAVEYIPNMMDHATARPLGQRGFICHWRVARQRPTSMRRGSLDCDVSVPILQLIISSASTGPELSKGSTGPVEAVTLSSVCGFVRGRAGRRERSSSGRRLTSLRRPKGEERSVRTQYVLPFPQA